VLEIAGDVAHNALRVDEALAANLSGLAGLDGGPSSVNAVKAVGHRTLTVVRKGGRRATAALAPDTAVALARYLEARADRDGVTIAELRTTDETLIATRTGAGSRRRTPGSWSGASPPRRHPQPGSAVAALAAAHRDHPGPRRRRDPARRPGLRRAPRPANDQAL
jgi:hypothetical protein